MIGRDSAMLADWKTASLGEICREIVVGHVGPSSQYRDPDGIPFLMGKNVSTEGISVSQLERVSMAFHQREKKSQLSPGDIVVVRIGKPGTAAVVPAEISPANCAGLVVLKSPFQADKQYLVRYLNSPQGQRYSLGQTRGSTRQTLNTKLVAQMPIPLPPLPEQKRIAAILDKADAARCKRRQTLDLADDFLRSTFLDLFGDPVTNPKGWPVRKLGDVVDFVSGGTPSKAKSEYWNGVIPWVSPKDMKRRYLEDAMDHVAQTAFDRTALHLIPPESVLIVVRGMILAHTVPIGMNRVPVAINQDMKAMLPTNEVDPVFLLFALLSQHQSILSKVGTAAHGTRRLEMRDVEALPVPIPAMPQQLHFRGLASQVEHASGVLATRADHADKLCGSLTQRAFRGGLST